MTNFSDLRVLITSAGRRGALVGCFREAGAGQVHGCDLVPDLSSACQLADMAHQVPRVTDPGYAQALAGIVAEHGIGLIVPTIDTELAALAEAAPMLGQAGARVHVSSPATIVEVRDKMRTMELLGAAGVPVPPTCREAELRAEPDRLGWPLFGKPSGGSASRGLGRYGALADLPDSFPEPMIFQPLLEGPEYTVNIFVDHSGQLRCVIPHLRLQTRAGEVEKGRTERRADLHEIARGITRALPDLRGVACFQVIDDARLGPVVIEINARFGGGYPLAHHAGARFADWLLDETAGQPCRAHDDWAEGVTMLRYDEAVFV